MAEQLGLPQVESVTNPMYDIFSPEMVDMSTVQYDMVEYRELNVSNSSGLAKLELETRDRDAFICPHDGALELRVRICTDNTDPGTPIPVTDIVALQNGAESLFKSTELYIEDQLIENITDPAIAHLFTNISHFSKQFGESIASNEHFYLDTQDNASIAPGSNLRFFNNTNGAGGNPGRLGYELFFTFAASGAGNVPVLTATVAAAAGTFQAGDQVIAKVGDFASGITVNIYQGNLLLTNAQLTITAAGQLQLGAVGAVDDQIRMKVSITGDDVRFFANALSTFLVRQDTDVIQTITGKPSVLNDPFVGSTPNIIGVYNDGFYKRWLQAKKSVNNNDLISLWIPLRHMFNFYQSYDKITRGLRHRVVLNKNSNNSEVLLRAGGADRYARIEYVSMWIPRVKPDLQTLKGIESKLNSNDSYLVNFTDLTCFHSNKILAGSGENSLQLATTKKKIVRVWIAFQKATRYEGDQTTNKRVFDNLLTQSIYCRLNGMLFPLYQYRFETSTVNGVNTWRYYNRAYHALMNASHKMRTDEDGSLITMEQFKDLYPIFYFDMQNQPEDLYRSLQISEVDIRWQNGSSILGTDYYVYCLYESERSLTIKGTSGNMVIALM